MRRILGLLLALHFAAFVWAQGGIGLNQAEPDTAGYYVKIPYEEVNGKLIVKAEVGGKPRRFIFNTGAATCISRTLANELMLPEKEDAGMADRNSSNNDTPIVTIGKVTFNGIAFKNVPALVLDSFIVFDCFKVDGFIGSNLLHKSIIQFSKEDSTIAITDIPDSLKLDKKYAAKLHLASDRNNPCFDIKLGNTKLRLLFDSGSDELMAINIDEFYKLQQKGLFRILGNTYESSLVGMSAVAENVEIYRLYLPRFTIGKNRLANAIVHTTDDESRMGVKLISHGKVAIDFINKQLYFEPDDPDRAYTNVRERYWSVSPGMQDGILVVGTVWDDLGQNINPGDRIIAIDGVSYRKRSECELLLKPLIDRRKNEALLTIENKDGIRRNVKIIK